MNHCLWVALNVVNHNNPYPHQIASSSNFLPAFPPQAVLTFQVLCKGTELAVCFEWPVWWTEGGVKSLLFIISAIISTERQQWRFDLCGEMVASCHDLLASKWKRTRGTGQIHFVSGSLETNHNEGSLNSYTSGSFCDVLFKMHLPSVSSIVPQNEEQYFEVLWVWHNRIHICYL